MIEEIKDFITKDECDQIIEFSAKEIKACNGNSDFMKMHPIEIKNENKEVWKKIRNLISDLTSLPVENQENFLAIRYDKNGSYMEHFDSFIKQTENSIYTKEFYEQSMASGGQRKFTALFYLNDNFSGGETNFPKLNKKIKPETGKLLYWNNLDENGNTNLNMIHAGMPVLDGQKWVLVVYIREKKYENKCQ